MSRRSGLAFLILLTVACARDDVRRDLDALVPRTIPPTVAAPYVSVTRTSETLETSWQMEPGMGWPTYREWLTTRLPEFGVRSSTDTELILSRILPADSYRLVVRPNGAVVVFEFTARAF